MPDYVVNDRVYVTEQFTEGTWAIQDNLRMKEGVVLSVIESSVRIKFDHSGQNWNLPHYLVRKVDKVASDLYAYKKKVAEAAKKGKVAAGSRWCDREFDNTIKDLGLGEFFPNDKEVFEKKYDSYPEGSTLTVAGFTVFAVKFWGGWKVIESGNRGGGDLSTADAYDKLRDITGQKITPQNLREGKLWG